MDQTSSTHRMLSSFQNMDNETHSFVQENKRIEKDEPIPSICIFRGMAILYMLFLIPQNSLPKDYSFNIFTLSYWNPITIGDIIPSMFIFIMGSSVFYSMNKASRSPLMLSSIALIQKIFKRIFLLCCIGIFLNLIYMPLFSFESILVLRIPSFLGRIALCYLLLCFGHISGILYLISLCIISVFIYIFFSHFYSVPFCGLNNMTKYCFCGAYFDQLIFTKNHILYPNDPQGLLGTLSALYTAFSGYIISYLMRKTKTHQMYTNGIPIFMLTVFNCVLWLIFNYVFEIPLNATTYSVSYAFLVSFVCLGIYLTIFSLLQLAVFKDGKYLGLFIWLGRNSIILYVLSEILNCIMMRIKIKQTGVALALIMKLGKAFGNNIRIAGMIYSFGFAVIMIGFAFVLHRKKFYITI